MVRPEKQNTVKLIKEKFEKSKEVIVTDYRGLSVKDLYDLRSKLREVGVEYKIYKNTLAKIAVTGQPFEGVKEYLVGPTAFAFDYENEVEAAKILTEHAKKQKNLEIKGGVIEGNVVDVASIKQYASLPSKEVLIAQTLGVFAAPVRQAVTVIAAPLQGFINVLKAKAEQAN
jgi:large subunit ribosomal protein L10